MIAPKALIFDVDGTLAETEEYHRLAFNQSFAAFDLASLWPDPQNHWHWDQPLYRRLLKIAGGKERLAHYLSHHLGIDPTPHRSLLDSLHRDKTGRYDALLRKGGLTLRPGIGALLDEARSGGLKLAIASTTAPANVDSLCQACFAQNAAAIFTAIAAGDQVAAKKPAPDVYHLALARLGLVAAEAVAFEDSRNGVLAAKAAGLYCIAAPSHYLDDDDLSPADLLLNDFSEIDRIRLFLHFQSEQRG